MARSWNPEFLHTDRERWICVYPAYINSRKTVAEGRKIPKTKCVENPTYTEIKDVCAAAGMVLGVENKVHPKERDARDNKYKGRIRVQLRNEDGTPMQEKFPTRKSIFFYIGETIPKLKGRAQSGGGSQPSASQQQSAGGGGQKKRGGKKGKR